MEAKKVRLLNKLSQGYINTLQIKDLGHGSFIFSPDSIWADGSDRWDGWCFGENKGFSRQEVEKLYDKKELYLDEHGVDDKFLKDLTNEFKAGLFPSILIDWCVFHICELKKPENIIKFLDDFKYKEYFLDSMARKLMSIEDAELIKLFIKKTRRYKCQYPYKKLKQAYKDIIKNGQTVNN